MVQHLLPKGFLRIRYYGLHATKTLQKWASAITEGFQKIGRQIEGTYQIVTGKHYWERYQESSGCDPLRCRHCGHDMAVWSRWHPKNGIIYDEVEQIKSGRYEPVALESATGVRGSAVRTTSGGVPLRCPLCGVELWVHETIIDFELGFAALEGREVKMPTLGCLGYNQESQEFTGLKNPPEGR